MSSLPLGAYTLEVTEWGRKDGLPSWLLTEWMEDRLGNTWMVSQGESLVRFDGHQFLTYGPTASKLDRIWGIASDGNNNIWIIGNNNGEQDLRIFVPKDQQFYSLGEFLPDAPALPIRDLNWRDIQIIGREDTIHICTATEGVWRYDGEFKKVFEPKPGSIKKEFGTRRVYPAPNNQFWEMTTDEALRLLTASGDVVKTWPQFTQDPIHYHLEEDLQLWGPSKEVLRQNRSSDLVQILHSDSTTNAPTLYHRGGVRIFDTQAYVDLLNEDGFTLRNKQEAIVIEIDGQVLEEDLESLLVKQLGIQLDRPFRPRISRSGDFWFRSTSGLVKLRLTFSPFRNYLHDFPSQVSTRGIIEIGQDSILVNTYQGTFLITPDGATTEIKLPDELGKIRYAIRTKDGDIWIGSGNSKVCRLNKQLQITGLFVPQSTDIRGNIFDFYFPNDTTVLLASQVGVLRINEQTQQVEPFALPDTRIYNFATYKGELWIATGNGLIHLPSGKAYLSDLNVNGDVNYQHIYVDPAGTFWVATDRGILKWKVYAEDYQFFDEQSGLSDRKTHSIYPDNKGFLWISSDYGLMRFDTTTLLFETLYKEDGLPHSEFNRQAHYQGPDQRLILGTLNGITCFHPDSIVIVDPAQELGAIQLNSAISFTARTHHAEALDFGSIQYPSLTIPSNSEHLELNFSVPYYGSNELIFEWRMLGYDESWTPINRYTLLLNRLSYGDYPLEVRCYLLGRQDVAQTLQIPLQVTAPIYLRNWFLFSAILLIICLTYWAYLWNIGRIQKQNRALEKLVSVRTRSLEIKNQKIAEQAETLKQLDKMKTRFFVNVSHEIRTPLSLILGPVEKLLNRSDIEPTTAKSLRRIQQNTTRLSQMVDELLELSRMEHDAIKLQEQVLEWPYWVEGICKEHDPIAQQKQIQLNFETSTTDSIYHLGDSSKLRRIADNLISNAVKYTQSGGRVVISTSHNDDQLFLTVEDNGPGIPTKWQSKIFDRYFRLEEGYQSGFGVGLTLSAEYAKLMGGQIHLASEEGKGSTFSFRFPLLTTSERPNVISDSPAVALPPSAGTKATVPETSTDQPHLLLVEDNLELGTFISETLAERYTITQATNGKEALELLTDKTNTIQLVISDLRMPIMDGYELLDAVRSNATLASTPFIILSAIGEDANKIKAFRLGVDGYLTKPFNVEELVARIDNIIANQRQRVDFLQEETQTEQAEPQTFDDIWLQELETVIAENLDRPDFKVPEIAQKLFISERTLRTRIKTLTGLSPAKYLQHTRLMKALEYLEHRRFRTASEVGYAVGFRNNSHFTKVFRNEFGRTPASYFQSSEAG
ncbi:MAG: ATP-binding protein [Bacteroidota bacterium]